MPIRSSGYWDNISKPVSLLDNGLKVARAGYDATTASNANLLFNSSWPSLQIYKLFHQNLSEGTNTWTSFKHELGFPPLALTFDSDMGNMEACSVDENYVYFNGYFPGQPTSKICIIYPVDISIDIDYPYTDAPSVRAPYNPDYGIKVVKKGKSITSNDLRDYILHSRCGSPMVLAVKTQDSTNPENAKLGFPKLVQYTSTVGYPVLSFGFSQWPSSYVNNPSTLGIKGYIAAPQQSQAAPSTPHFGNTVFVSPLNIDDNSSLVILRSPQFSATTRSIIY